MKYIYTLFVTLTLLTGVTAMGEPNKKVQAALDYELQAKKCKKPYLKGVSDAVINDDGVQMQYDVDHYKLERYERKTKFYHRCITKYKKSLMSDVESMRKAIAEGVTPAQAETIKAKMIHVQSVINAQES